jgi:hypothetical protein
MQSNKMTTPAPLPKAFRDRLGNLWDENDHMIEPSPIPGIDIYHFYCIVCKDVKPFDQPKGFYASLEAGGWLCGYHILPG